MKIEISTEFETSLTEDYRATIVSKIVDHKGTVLCQGEDRDAWPNDNERRASVLVATKNAIAKFEQLLSNVKDVAKKSGLLQ